MLAAKREARALARRERAAASTSTSGLSNRDREHAAQPRNPARESTSPSGDASDATATDAGAEVAPPGAMQALQAKYDDAKAK